MTVREAILRAVPVFAAHTGGGPDALRSELTTAGLPAALAAEVVEFLPIAVARAMLNGMGVRFADFYVRQSAQGQVIGQKRLDEEPVYSAGLAMADEIGRMGDYALTAVVNYSSEYQAISRALNGGSRAEDLTCAPPVMLANNDDRRAFDDTSGGAPRKPWWRLWG
ncbi:hypothetical protein [Frigoriglobus tundricola]|uniref:Uncharacterized protein n=1 Tax=Frigoriglobus tundricola TaxID=2774151 RepID=A0A6M5Z2C6_9BACT|nr:hypothetical protein [Frigoriglobus tundricola]QJW99730.1 hypothetical protein FTUN_7353 [Frigoriglobus tundricola]